MMRFLLIGAAALGLSTAALAQDHREGGHPGGGGREGGGHAGPPGGEHGPPPGGGFRGDPPVAAPAAPGGGGERRSGAPRLRGFPGGQGGYHGGAERDFQSRFSGGQGGYRGAEGFQGQLRGGEGGYRGGAPFRPAGEGGDHAFAPQGREGRFNGFAGEDQGARGGAAMAPEFHGQPRFRPRSEGGYAVPGSDGRGGFHGNGRFSYRGRSFDRFHAWPYRYPVGWGYRRWGVGAYLPPLLVTSSYLLDDFEAYDLGPPPPDCRWVRYGPDALLVNVDTGEVVDVAHGVFWW